MGAWRWFPGRWGQVVPESRRLLVTLALLGALLVLVVAALPDEAPSERADEAILTQALLKGAPPGPEVSAPSAILVDADSGQVLYAKNAHERRAPASVTKIATMDVVLDALAEGKASIDDIVSVSDHAMRKSDEETTMFLEGGDQVKLRELLIGVAVASANDATIALAEHIGGSVAGFVDMMNAKARDLGMKDTLWGNPSGLPGDAPHYTSAYDLALLSRHLVTQHPDVLNYTRMWEYWFQKGGKKFWLTNFNRGLVEYPGMDGLKTGWTEEAGYCLAATAKQGARRLIAVVMGAATPKDRQRDIYRLMDWGFSAFDTVRLAAAGKAVGKVRLYEGREREVPVVPAETVAITVPRAERKLVKSELTLSGPVVAPVREGQTLGTIRVLRGKDKVRRIPAVAARGVPRASVAALALRYWRGLWIPGAGS